MKGFISFQPYFILIVNQGDGRFVIKHFVLWRNPAKVIYLSLKYIVKDNSATDEA